MNRSRTLAEYSDFVARARENIDNGFESARALEKAVKDCIKDNVLKEFLEIYGSDVINMLSMEFSLDDALRVREKDGIIKGEQNKAEKVAEKLLERGMSIGDVAEDTELSIERVEQIAHKIKSKQIKA